MPPKTAKAPAKPKASAPKTTKRATRRRTPPEDQIAVRAYFISQETGGVDPVENWLRAERELMPA